MSGKPKVTYSNAVRSFDHGQLARYPAYSRLRRALSDLANESGRDKASAMGLGGFLEAVRDMALTAPYGDNCRQCMDFCGKNHTRQPDGDMACGYCGYQPNFPHQVERSDHDTILGHYRCPAGHEWTCSYHISIAYWDW